MPANRAPNYDVPVMGPGGTMNQAWYRFFASLAGQFSGVDASLMPVDAGSILSIANAQSKPAGRGGETADNALISLAMPPAASRDNGALDLAQIALSRPQQRQRAGLQLIQDTLANRPAVAGFSDGSVLFIATDNFQIYYVQGGAWVQAYGFMSYNPAGPLLTVTPETVFSGAASAASLAATGTIVAGTTITAGTGLTVTAGGASITGTVSATTLAAAGAITAGTPITAGTTLFASSTVQALAGFISGVSVGEAGVRPLAKLTLAGTNGSITFTGGIETAHVDPT